MCEIENAVRAETTNGVVVGGTSTSRLAGRAVPLVARMIEGVGQRTDGRTDGKGDRWEVESGKGKETERGLQVPKPAAATLIFLFVWILELCLQAAILCLSL